MPGAQNLGRVHEERADFIRRGPACIGTKPVQQPFDFDIDDAVGVQDVLHILEAVFLPDLEDIRVPKSHAGKSGLRRDLHTGTEVMQAALIAVWIRSYRESPEGS